MTTGPRTGSYQGPPVDLRGRGITCPDSFTAMAAETSSADGSRTDPAVIGVWVDVAAAHDGDDVPAGEAEIFAAWQGADYIRTHDVAATRDALTFLAAITRETSRA
jgi:hypothetical protein